MATTVTATTQLKWKQRRHVRERNGFRYRRLVSVCGRYAIEDSHYLGEAVVPDVWRALVMEFGGWAIISHHQKRGPAEAACEKHARE